MDYREDRSDSESSAGSSDRDGSGSDDSFDTLDMIRMYTDGACVNNGGADPRAGIGVHFPDYDEYDISERLAGRQTSNRAEIEAVRSGLEMARILGHDNATVYTDSNFVIKSMTEWLPLWKINGWRTSDSRDVINKPDFQALEREIVWGGLTVIWVWMQ
jgi:ribonuclease HI